MSPKFVTEFAKVLKQKFEVHPYEALPVPYPVVNWMIQPKEPTYDYDHAEEALTQAAESDFLYVAVHVPLTHMKQYSRTVS